MSENTKIEWCDHTFNPWVGCTKISPACDHCYAEGWAKRSGQVVWGGERKRTSIANWKLPLKWNQQAATRQHEWEIYVSMHPDGETATIAAGYIKPARPKVFCASLADVFDNEVPVQWRMDLFNLIADTPHIDWLILTKRIGNVMTMCSGDSLMFDMIGERVWLGATICNQEEADRDIPKLMAVPAHKRFLSMEPLLGPVDLTHLNNGKEINEVDCLKPDTWEDEISQWRGTEDGWEESFEDHYGVAPVGLSGPMHNKIDWVIVGGESGSNARPMHPQWARDLRDQCDVSGVPYLFKQWGQWREPFEHEEFDTSMGRASKPPAFIISKSGTVHCFESEHIVDGKVVISVGKKAAGRLLDGREWNGVPA